MLLLPSYNGANFRARRECRCRRRIARCKPRVGVTTPRTASAPRRGTPSSLPMLDTWRRRSCTAATSRSPCALGRGAAHSGRLLLCVCRVAVDRRPTAAHATERLAPSQAHGGGRGRRLPRRRHVPRLPAAAAGRGAVGHHPLLRPGPAEHEEEVRVPQPVPSRRLCEGGQPRASLSPHREQAWLRRAAEVLTVVAIYRQLSKLSARVSCSLYSKDVELQGPHRTAICRKISFKNPS